MSNQPNTWTSYAAAEKASTQYDGIGLIFANGLGGIDIDKCVGTERDKMALEIIKHMDIYTEYSPSGKGYHIIFRYNPAKIPADYKDCYYQKNIPKGIECYLSGFTNRFFTYTGEAISDTDVEERTDQLLSFLDKYMKKTKLPGREDAQEGAAGKDIDVPSIVRKAKNGKQFIKLFDYGDISDYATEDQPDGDNSAADLALCRILAFYCQGDEDQIDYWFRQSALYRNKWDRDDYRKGTIEKAVASCTKFYNPGGRPKKEPRTVDDSGVKFINPLSDSKRYSLDDIGMGYLFADTYKFMSRYVPESRAWYVFNGKVWRHDLGDLLVWEQTKALTDFMFKCALDIKDGRQRNEFLKFVMQTANNRGRKIMLDEARSVYPISILEFDKDPYILNCQNCTLNLQSKTVHAHRASDFLSKIANAEFNKNSKCERWEKFIDEIMVTEKGEPDCDKAKFLQKAIGYSLAGDVSEECFFILYGCVETVEM